MANEDVTMDPNLEHLVNRMFNRSFDEGKFKQVIY